MAMTHLRLSVSSYVSMSLCFTLFVLVFVSGAYADSRDDGISSMLLASAAKSDSDDRAEQKDKAEDDEDDKHGDDDHDNADAPAAGVDPSHAGFFTTYEGAKTCMACHATEVHQVHQSVHYQLHGDAPYVINASEGGKLGAINDYCGYPDFTWIGKLTNLDGVQVDGGCAACHVGMGAKPSAEPSTAQLENIDCLMCHSKHYKRRVAAQADGSFRFEPAPDLMSVPLLQAITDIQETPGRDTCVNCHAYAGGGCNNKRGDIEEAHREPPSASFDVHMASKAVGGAGLVCVDCHVTRDHRIAGRGVDLAVTDLDVPVRCTNCHDGRPHDNRKLDRHTARIDCTVCHIPRFAKIATTDMVRDYSKPAHLNEARRLYDPHIERAGNVVPAYRFFNGLSWIYQFGTVATPGESGRVAMAVPLGDRHDVDAKLFAFKHHLAVQPYDPVSQRIIPQHMGVYFQTGDIDAAVARGVQMVGWTLDEGFTFIPTERYQGIYHEVSPADEALQCNDCHGGGRMDFVALGYAPKETRNGRPLCASCHEPERASFSKLHSEHVGEEGIACGACHTFQ